MQIRLHHQQTCGVRFAKSWFWFVPLLCIALSLGLFVLVPIDAQADDPAFLLRRAFGPTADPTEAVATGDINRDGHLDLIVGNGTDTPGVVYLNDTRGNFYNGPVDCDNLPDGVRCFGDADLHITAVALGDIDGDDDLDIVAGHSNAAIRSIIYLNDGTGQFHTGPATCGSTPDVRCFGDNSSGPVEVYAVALGDLDGQNGLDIALGLNGGQNAVFFNDGAGAFFYGAIDPAAPPPRVQLFGVGFDSTWSLALGDLDGQNGLDIVVGNRESENLAFLNQGAGSFYSGPLTCGATAGVRCLGAAADKTSGVALGDIDGDNDFDIVASNQQAPNAIYLNDGSGTFATSDSFGDTDPSLSLALADFDSDGDLDAIIGNEDQQSVIYLNDGAGSLAAEQTFGSRTGVPSSVAAADLDSDSDIDVIVGNRSLQNEIYVNNGAGSFTSDSVQPVGGASDRSVSIATGDMNGDGSLDLVVGKVNQQHTLYLNDGAGVFTAESFGNAAVVYADVAVGDLDGDNDLDIVTAADGGQNAVFLNDGTGSFPTGGFVCGVSAGVICFGTSSDATHSLGLADLNGDERLDIVAGNSDDQQNAIYLNDGSGRFHTGSVRCDGSQAETVRCLGAEDDTTRSIAIGDIDGDSAPDLVVGNASQPNRVYLNDGAGNFATAATLGSGLERTQQVALSDLDGNGSLDVIVGNSLEQNAVFLNDGGGNFASGPIICGERDDVKCFGNGLDDTQALVLADLDGDGDNDIITGNNANQSAAYLNDGRGNFSFRRTFGTATDATFALAMGDLDHDGDLDLAVGRDNQQSHIYLNGLTGPARLATPQAAVVISQPGETPAAEGFATPTILTEQVIPIRYDLDAPVDVVRAYYSPDGGGRWLEAKTAGGTNLIDNPQPAGDGRYTFEWDTFASGFFGQSDNVVFRIEAYPGAQISSVGLPGPFQRPYLAAQTFPFRVRGTQVQVTCQGCEDTDATPADALVYRLPKDEIRGALPISAGSQAGAKPFRTDQQGFLEGRGELAVDDQLIALAPISATETYTLYFTNAAPTAEGLDADTVDEPGVQELIVSPANPLLVFNLDVSLEWDARSDEQYLARLREDFRRTAAILFDWTDGQAVLGDITIHHDRELWNDAHIRVYATNRLRPNANQGGIVTTPLSETVVVNNEEETTTYDPGQVRMGAVWNRYGEASGTIGEDWPRTLAHELGHFALFLDDNYIGLDASGTLVPVRDCPGAMSDPYIDNYSEFHPTANWLPSCAQTLSHQNTGRSDWATMTTFYPYLDAPAEFNANAGPSILPLEVTRTRFVAPDTPDDARETLEVPIIYLTDASGAAVQPEPDGRAFLFQPDKQRLLDLGRTVLDRVDARGAREGDRLCVYNLEQGRLGCEEELSLTDQQLELTTLQQPWQPELVITPVTSRTVEITVAQVEAGLTLRAQIYPLDYPALEPITLTENDGQYTGTFELPEPVFTGYVHTWVEEQAPRREAVSDYAIGGNPGSRRNRLVSRNNPGSRRNRLAPVLSSDGQAILYTQEDNFAVGEFYALQSTRVIEPLPWANVVGQAYRLTATANAPQLVDNASISIGYLTGEVVPGEEQWIKIYYRQDNDWQQLDTTLDMELNTASAPTQGPGEYALMSTIEFPLEEKGWNLLPYPVQDQQPRPLSTALGSIEGRYTTVYGYYPLEAQPWRLYDIDAPEWLNRGAEFGLTTLEFGRSYWIRATEPLTVSFKGGQADMTPDGLALAEAGLPYPPATYYTELQAENGFVPRSGMPVTARIGDTVCGTSTVQDLDDKLVFVLHVTSAVGGQQACGLPGRTVTITVGSATRWEGVAWDNNRPHDLSRPVDVPNPLIYLPLVQR